MSQAAEAITEYRDLDGAEMLRVSDLHAFYGESHILHGVDFDVKRGELVTLLGRNGAGRSTTLKAIMNMVGHRTGSIVINGNETLGMKPHRIPRLGIGYCPEERGIFASLDVEENLLLPPTVRSGGMEHRRDLRDVPQPLRAAAQPGHAALRRRTADAGHGAHSAYRCALAAAG